MTQQKKCFTIINTTNKRPNQINMQEIVSNGDINVYDILGNKLYTVEYDDSLCNTKKKRHKLPDTIVSIDINRTTSEPTWSEYVTIKEVMMTLGLTRNAVYKRAKRGVTVKMKKGKRNVPLYTYLKP